MPAPSALVASKIVTSCDICDNVSVLLPMLDALVSSMTGAVETRSRCHCTAVRFQLDYTHVMLVRAHPASHTAASTVRFEPNVALRQSCDRPGARAHYSVSASSAAKPQTL